MIEIEKVSNPSEPDPMEIFAREHENDFSFWFPKIQFCGIPVPKTFFKKLPHYDQGPEARRLYQAFCMENPAEDLAVVQTWLNTNVLPELKEMGLMGHVFVKNARFSNKFDANGNCNLFGTFDLARAFANINYEAMCLDANGCDEIVVREFIEASCHEIPCIYNGLPLRPEFRVFYDFDTQQPIFTANYWDFDYVYPHLYAATDRIIFEHERERIETAFNQYKDEVQEMVSNAMKSVQGLTGQWSIDILYDENTYSPHKFWLIDMAIAQRSAYWEQRPKEVTRV